ncbi:hypothetical protein HU200_014303 [Digitaria exilis]|uniref:J domain-containing protein n=1 Tax=Digitaria exilis TaxID=1010633 RepID=A0A835FBT9_9POAL|nr:hypothetical protein HU200_014303 [Digitaria exilis]
MAASTATRPFTPLLHQHQPRHRRRVVVAAASTPDAEPTAAGAKKKTVDTRIHWSDPDEGWVGGKAKKEGDGGRGKNEPLGGRFLGIAPEADIEEIKAAYRRLSKEYHPDTTTLPLKTASEKFIRLREVYNVLSKEETRRFYDWTLAQEAESRRLQQLRNMKLSDQAMTALTIDIVIIIISACCIIYAVFFKEQY